MVNPVVKVIIAKLGPYIPDCARHPADVTPSHKPRTDRTGVFYYVISYKYSGVWTHQGGARASEIILLTIETSIAPGSKFFPCSARPQRMTGNVETRGSHGPIPISWSLIYLNGFPPMCSGTPRACVIWYFAFVKPVLLLKFPLYPSLILVFPHPSLPRGRLYYNFGGTSFL